MSAPRVVIRSMINRRDSAACLLLAAVLRRMGCKVRVCSQRDFTTVLKLWSPHVAVSNASGTSVYIRKVAPNTKSVFWDGEGVNVPGYTAGSSFSRNPKLFDNYDRVLLWGKWSFEDLQATCPSFDFSKVRVVGNPHLDLVRFLPNSLRKGGESNSVGVLTRFRLLNPHDGSSSIKLLLNDNNLNSLKSQANDFVALCNAVNVILDRTDFQVEIRPHPLERVESYEENKRRWFGKNADRVKVDACVSFGEFAARQKLLITPTSTSFLQSYLLGVPIVDSSVLGATQNYNMDGDLGKEWLDAAVRPTNYDELVSLVEGARLTVKHNVSIEYQLSHYCDLEDKTSATLRAAQEIFCLAKDTHVSSIRVPHLILDILNYISFKRTMRRDPNHLNFCYKSGFHRSPSELQQMVDRILSEQDVVVHSKKR